MKKAHCAVIGTGIFGGIHCKAYSSYEKSKLQSVCDLDENKAKETAGEYGCQFTTDYNEIAKNESVDIVSITTPDHTHTEPALAMIEAGKHLLIEKPMTTDVKEAETILKAAGDNGVRIMTDFHNRFNPPFVITKQRLDNGELGGIVSMYAEMNDKITVPLKWFNWSENSGPHWFLFPHLIDLLCWFKGDLPQNVFARGVKKILKGKDVDCYDMVSAMLDFGDSYAVVESSWIMPENWTSLAEFSVSMQTSQGKIKMDVNDLGMRVASDVKKYVQEPFYTANTDVHGQNFGFIEFPIRHFVDCVLEDINPIITPSEGVNNVKIISSIEDSMQSGGRIDIDYN